MKELIKPVEISLKSNVGGKEIEKHFRIGRYPSTKGLYLFTMAVEVFGSAVKNHEQNAVPAKKVMEFAFEACKFCEAKMPNGEYINLDSEFLIDSHVPDYEMLMSLIRKIHDENSFFFSSERLLKTSLGTMDKLKGLAMKMLTPSSQSSKPKK